jgi:hypothetical protein
MHSLFRRFTPLLLAVAIASPVAITGCQQQPPQTDETVIYTQWEHETHRNHQDLNKRSPDEQKQYSDWRSNHH